jgi:hypothetical protein
MKKGVRLAVLFLAMILVLLSFSTAIFNAPIVTSCANVHLVWQSMFNASFGGTVIGQTGDGKCTHFMAYKITGNLTDVLFGYDTPSYANRTVYYIAIEGNLSTAFQNNLTSLTYENISNFISNLNFAELAAGAYPRNVNSIVEANTLYSSTFKVENSSWSSSGSGQSLVYRFNNSENNGTTNVVIGGTVSNQTLSYLIYNRTLNLVVPSCIQNWTAVSGACNSSDYILTWYNDTNNCNNATGRPANVTLSCDYDSNGIIGNFSSFTDTNLDLRVYINDSLGNISKTYTGTRQVDFREIDSEIDRLTFNYSFDSPLDVRGISVEIEDGDSHYGYIVVRGLNVTKTVRLNKLNSSSVRVCVKNSDGTIDDITSDCEGTREYLVDCPGSSGSIKCSIDGGLFVVSGISRSIVREWLGDLNETLSVSCTTNWSCSAWSDCNSTGSKTKICIDKAFCNSTVGKPAVVESCTPVTVCNTNWSCSDWAPSECPSNLTQTRICRDTNACNVNSGKPNQTRTCERRNGTSWGFIGIIVAVIVLIIIAVIIILMKLNNKDDNNYVNVQGIGGPRTPPSGPSPGNGYAPIIVRPAQRPLQNIPMQPMSPQPRPMPSGVPFGTY